MNKSSRRTRSLGLPLTAALAIFASFTGIGRADPLDAVFYDSRFGSIDSGTGAYTGISMLPVVRAAGIAFSKGSLYVEDFANNLLLLNPVTGASQILGNTGLGLDISTFSGGGTGLYAIDYSSNLYSIDPANGSATLIGNTGIAANWGRYDTSLSFDGAALLYTAGLPGESDELYRIDISTGVATDLGSTGLTGISGSAFTNGELDVFQYGQPTNYIFSAADGSNSFTRGAALGTQVVDGAADLSERQILSTPEPVSLNMAGSALAGLALFMRRRRTAR